MLSTKFISCGACLLATLGAIQAFYLTGFPHQGFNEGPCGPSLDYLIALGMAPPRPNPNDTAAGAGGRQVQQRFNSPWGLFMEPLDMPDFPDPRPMGIPGIPVRGAGRAAGATRTAGATATGPQTAGAVVPGTVGAVSPVAAGLQPGFHQECRCELSFGGLYGPMRIGSDGGILNSQYNEDCMRGLSCYCQNELMN